MRTLEGILSQKHIEAGLWLREDEDLVFLWLNFRVVARWSSHGATRENIIAEADKFLEERGKEK